MGIEKIEPLEFFVAGRLPLTKFNKERAATREIAQAQDFSVMPLTSITGEISYGYVVNNALMEQYLSSLPNPAALPFETISARTFRRRVEEQDGLFDTPEKPAGVIIAHNQKGDLPLDTLFLVSQGLFDDMRAYYDAEPRSLTRKTPSRLGKAFIARAQTNAAKAGEECSMLAEYFFHRINTVADFVQDAGTPDNDFLGRICYSNDGRYAAVPSDVALLLKERIFPNNASIIKQVSSSEVQRLQVAGRRAVRETEHFYRVDRLSNLRGLLNTHYTLIPAYLGELLEINEDGYIKGLVPERPISYAIDMPCVLRANAGGLAHIKMIGAPRSNRVNRGLEMDSGEAKIIQRAFSHALTHGGNIIIEGRSYAPQQREKSRCRLKGPNDMTVDDTLKIRFMVSTTGQPFNLSADFDRSAPCAGSLLYLSDTLTAQVNGQQFALAG